MIALHLRHPGEQSVCKLEDIFSPADLAIHGIHSLVSNVCEGRFAFLLPFFFPLPPSFLSCKCNWSCASLFPTSCHLRLPEKGIKAARQHPHSNQAHSLHLLPLFPAFHHPAMAGQSASSRTQEIRSSRHQPRSTLSTSPHTHTHTLFFFFFSIH